MHRQAKVLATGSFLPDRILSNQDLEKMVETSDEWIVTRTGMRERRIAGPEEFTSTMAIKAAQKALDQAGIQPEQLDAILVATLTPDYPFPSTACLVQKELGAKNAMALDVQAACSGYLYALSLAKAYVESGMYQTVLVIASEKLSSITDYKDRSTCILFGDGASACIVGEGVGLAIRSIQLGADGEQADLLIMPGGGCRHPASQTSIEQKQHYIKMAGNEVFKHAVRRMEAACKGCLDELGLSEAEISWVVPHQANIRILDAIAKRFDHLPSNRIYKTLHKYGNTSASSIGIALDELLKSEPVQSGDKILLTAFGGGFTWGAAVLEAGV